MTPPKEIPIEDQAEDFEGLAVEKLEEFINSMENDRRFVIPVEEYDGPVEDTWSHVYTDRAAILIDRFISRLYRLGRAKYGEKVADNMEISTYLYQEL